MHGKMMMGIAVKKARSPRLHQREESNNQDLQNQGIYQPKKVFIVEDNARNTNMSKRGALSIKGTEKKMTSKDAYLRSRGGTRVHFQEDHLRNVEVKNFVFHEKYGAIQQRVSEQDDVETDFLDTLGIQSQTK